MRKIINFCYQKLLSWFTHASHLRMGIGSATSVSTSGEKEILKRLMDHLKNQEQITILDVGANKGQFIEMLLDVKEDQNVFIHAFEPASAAFELISKKYSKYENIKINHSGLASAIGKKTLYYDSPGSGLASLSKRRLGHFDIDFSLKEMVDLITLDEYSIQNQIESIDLLKLDVEGYELDVLYGGLLLFANLKIENVLFEFGGANIDTRTFFQDFYYFFQKNEMKNIYRITPSGYLFPIKKYKEDDEQFRTTMFLAAREPFDD